MLITEIMRQAEKKDPNAMFELAEAYYLGDRGVSADDDKAFSLYKELEVLTPDDGMVMYRLGKCYEFGIGADKDTKLALDYYQKAVEKGSGIACKTLGEFYKTGKYVQQDISKCLEYLNKGSKLGTPGSDEAAITLGDMYHSGDGVEKNDTKACGLYRIAADLGNSNAYYRLGMQTFNGWGVEADKAKGMEYWEKGAELNHWGCMYIIGVSYVEGRDLPRDIEKGMYWLECSADRGLADACCYLGKVYLRGLHGVSQNEAKGVQYLKDAAYSDQGQKEAMMIYGDYLYGQNTSESLSEALTLYHRAAELGEPAAYHRLGMLTYNGVGVEPDKDKGVEYWKKGVELGQIGCMYIIGGLYMEGTELPKDIDQGLFLLEKAAANGMPDAHNYLGKVYLQGLHGVPKDETKALQHLKSAAKTGDTQAMVLLGDYYGELNTDEGFAEAIQWYEKAADSVPYAMRQAIAASQIVAIGGGVEGWEKVEALSKTAIDRFQRGRFELRDEYLEFANNAFVDAKYQQALCFYRVKEYSKAMSLTQGLNYRDSNLLNALSFFGKTNDEDGDFNAAYKMLLTVFTEASRSVTGDRELYFEEEQMHATAASVVASGYQTGIPGVVRQFSDGAIATLQNTIKYLKSDELAGKLHEQVEKYKAETAPSSSQKNETVSPQVKERKKETNHTINLPEPNPNDKFGWARSADEKESHGTSGKPVHKQGTNGGTSQSGNENSGTKTLLYILIGLMSAVVILLSILVLKNHQKRPADNNPSATEQTEVDVADAVKEETPNGVLPVTDSELLAEDITIDRHDFSILDDTGETVVALYYDLVQLPETTEAFRKINETLSDDYWGYYYGLDDLQEDFERAKAAKAENDGSGYEWWAYVDTINASVETCEDGILSLLFYENWYMGGVANHNGFGATFNTRTGELITLEDIGEAVPEKGDFLEYLKTCIYNEMEKNGDVYEDTEDAISTLHIEDLQFYLDNKELMIYINTYQVASGAVGSFAVPTGIIVNI